MLLYPLVLHTGPAATLAPGLDRIGDPNDAELREALARSWLAFAQVQRLTDADETADQDRATPYADGRRPRPAGALRPWSRAATELVDALDRTLIEIGDSMYLFEQLQRERVSAIRSPPRSGRSCTKMNSASSPTHVRRRRRR